jgi:hypothetical protein
MAHVLVQLSTQATARSSARFLLGIQSRNLREPLFDVKMSSRCSHLGRRFDCTCAECVMTCGISLSGAGTSLAPVNRNTGGSVLVRFIRLRTHTPSHPRRARRDCFSHAKQNLYGAQAKPKNAFDAGRPPRFAICKDLSEAQMSQRIRTFEAIMDDGETYRPRVYAELNADDSWNAYIAFWPVTGSIVTTDYLATGPTVGHLIDWADTLTLADLRAAVARAKTLNRASTLAADVARLKFLEGDALNDAQTLQNEADRDEAAAATARAEAEILRRERLQAESAAAEWQETLANASAVEHENEAQKARAAAANAKAKKKAAEKASKSRQSKQ